ncbi:MAG: thiamine pyrophosphate-dependent enzyme [bacterium]|nr:thiamine pyrophosphate-dependent enzyme [bacterium]
MAIVFKKPRSMTDTHMHYCPGCGHGVAHRLVAEVIDELNVREETIAVAPVGCAVLAYDYWDFDVTESAHGRAPAVATGIKRVFPDKVVFTYQGDGDLISIGGNELLHCANRGENITVVFINNTVYGMTGGQMAPTTLPGQKTTTTPLGRDPATEGHPIRVCELLSSIPGVKYLERVSLDKTANIIKARKALMKAFQAQLDKKGFSLVEMLTPCPTNWGMNAHESLKFISNDVIKYFPTGVIKDEL